MLRRKSPAQRIIAGILSFTMILWTVAPSTVILAQPVTVPPLGAPTFQTTDFDPYFAAANQSSSETGWEQTVAQAKAVLAAQWEIQAETQIQGHLAGISTSDAFNTVTEYRDYLRKELEIQKQSSRSQWELAAEVSIASNRDTFLTALVNRQYDQTTQQGQSYVSAGNAAADAGVQSQIDAARQQFEATFNAGVNQSLNEYNVALAQIQAEAEAFLIELQQADQQFQANLQAIEVYETNVRTGIQGASTQLRNQLNTNGMFYVQNCDAQNQCTADMGQMTAAGQTLQTLLASIDNGLATNVPLSTLATQLTTYLQNRETAATTERDTWDAAIYENRTGSNAQRLGYGLDYAAYQANDPIVHGVLQYLRFGSTAELTGLLGSGHRTAQDFSGVELLGWSVAHIPYPVTANSFRKNQRWVADGVGESALTYDAVGCGGPPPICLTNPFAPFGVNGWGEQFVDVQYSYRMYDPNAENNRDVWQQYAGDINLEYTAWNGTLLPALQSWETQVAQYEANYSAWQTQRAAVEQQNLQAFQQKRDAILTDRNQYLNRVQAAYRDGLAQFGNLEKQLAAEATAAAAESAKNSTANGATASGGVNANFILQNGLQNAAGYTRALGNPRNAARILEAANSRVTAQVDGSFLERGQISGPNLELPRDLLSSFNKTLNGTFGIAVVEQQNQDAKDAQKQATSDLVAMLNKLTADTSVSDRELHASLVGMMDYKITEDTDIMSIELDWEKLEVKDQAEFDKLKENVRKSIEDSKKRKQFKSVELQDDGRIKITRDVSTGSSVLRAGGDALNAEDYVQVMREDTFYVEGSGALKLATTPGLFSAEFDVNETIHNFEASRAEFEQGIQKLFGDTNNRVEAENSAMEALHRRGKQDAQAQAELANQMVDLAKSLIMGGTVASWIQGQINGKVSALIEEATGLPAGFISGMLGGMKPHQALQSYVEGQMYAAIDTAFGLPAGVFSHLASQHKAEQKRKNDPNRKMMRDMVNFYTGAWIPGNPLKGQLNKLADKVGDYAQKNPMVIDAIGMATGTYWMTKAVQGGYKGGALGAGAELVSGGLTAAGIVFTAGTVDANVSYTYEDGWAGDVSVGVGVAPFRASAGVGYSDKGGLSANLGVTAGFGSSGLALGVNWSENEGFGGFAGVTLADGAVSLGVGYSKREGFGGFVGAGDLQVSYSERAGFGAGLSMAHQSSGVGLDFKITEKLGTTVGMNYGQSVGNGASVSGGVSYNTQTGMSANMNVSVDPSAAGFADESDMAGKFQGNGNTVNMGMSWSEEDGLGVSGPSASRQYITSLDGLQSTVAGQARALRAAANVRSEGDYMGTLIKGMDGEKWSAMSEEQRQAFREANKERIQEAQSGAELTEQEIEGYDTSRDEGFFSQLGGAVTDSLLSIVGTNSSNAGYIDDMGKFVPRTCFVAGTLVHTTRGLVPIEELKIHDRALSINLQTGEKSYQLIREIFVRHTDRIYRIFLDNGSELETTATHPIYIAGAGWVEARRIQEGDRVITATEKELVVLRLTIVAQYETVYNFTVEENHNYYVAAAGILVHNQNGYAGVQFTGDFERGQGQIRSPDGQLVYDQDPGTSLTPFEQRQRADVLLEVCPGGPCPDADTATTEESTPSSDAVEGESINATGTSQSGNAATDQSNTTEKPGKETNPQASVPQEKSFLERVAEGVTIWDGVEFIPFVGDLVGIGRDSYDLVTAIADGDWSGAGWAGAGIVLGVGGFILDFIPGAGTAASTAVTTLKQGIKHGARAAAKRADDVAEGAADVARVSDKIDPPYNPKQTRTDLEQKYGPENVQSTTVPPENMPNVSKAGESVHGVPYDSRGFPIFDNVAAFDHRFAATSFDAAGYAGQMRMATRTLRESIKSGQIPLSRFTPEAQKAIMGGKSKIPGYTWHHHQDTGRMQLIPTEVHDAAKHVGGDGMRKGK
jgi:hypothetical protein